MTSIESIADTAFLTAYARAVETDRPDALFSDPHAAKLLTERGRALGQNLEGAFMRGWSIVVRTVIIDDFILRAIAGGVDTVLNLGAGLDTRPYRMDVPASLRWVEVDQPQVIQFKRERLAEETPHCSLELFECDLLDVAARREVFSELSGSNALLVITEGVIPYFTVDAVSVLATDLHALPSARGWIVDSIPKEVIALRRNMPTAGQTDHAPLLFDPEDGSAFFAERGFRAGERRSLFEEGARVGRPMPIPPGAPPRAPNNASAPPTGRGGFLGYVMLEPIR